MEPASVFGRARRAKPMLVAKNAIPRIDVARPIGCGRARGRIMLSTDTVPAAAPAAPPSLFWRRISPTSTIAMSRWMTRRTLIICGIREMRRGRYVGGLLVARQGAGQRFSGHWVDAGSWMRPALGHRAGLDDLPEIRQVEACPAYERAIDPFGGEDLRRVAALDGAAV